MPVAKTGLKPSSRLSSRRSAKILPNEKAKLALQRLRDKLRVQDDAIIKKIMARTLIVEKIGQLKKAHELAIFDAAREKFNRAESRKISKGRLPAAMVDEITDLLASWAKTIQKG
jgi:chorismate mutase